MTEFNQGVVTGALCVFFGLICESIYKLSQILIECMTSIFKEKK